MFTPRAIDIIIDYYANIIKPNIIHEDPHTPIAQLSIFGWLIIGAVHSSSPSTGLSHHVSIQPAVDHLQKLLTKFWVQEEPPSSIGLTLSQDEECEQFFRNTHHRDSTGRYVVCISLSSPTSKLGDSYNTALSTFHQLKKRLARNETLAQLYHHFMQEYEELGHMSKVPSQVLRFRTAFNLPHHGAMKPNSTTTKLRVVFNGSVHTSSGLSVNDIMHACANLLLNILDLLIWIRHHRHLFAMNITKMYRQVRINPLDWDLQRIICMDAQGKEMEYYL